MERLYRPIVMVLAMAPAIISANDGVFYARGDTLFPVQESSIRLAREVLSLTRDGDHMKVSVDLVFINPGKERDLLVGFVTPPASGDVSDETASHPFISDFRVTVNGDSLNYAVTVLEKTGFSLKDENATGMDFVYHFKARFRKGTNRIHHAYRFKGSATVLTSAEFPYRLTTAKLWANRGVDDFRCVIDMGGNAYYSVPYSFTADGSPAPWTLEGTGKISETALHPIHMPVRMVAVRKGRLLLHVKNFSPDYDLNLAEYYPRLEVHIWGDGSAHPFVRLADIISHNFTEDDLHGCSGAELRLLRNYSFARKGYMFKDRNLRGVFSRFTWYIPDPAVTDDPALLSGKDRELLKSIDKEIERRSWIKK